MIKIPQPSKLFASNAIFATLLLAIFLGFGITLSANDFLAQDTTTTETASLFDGVHGYTQLAAEGGGGGSRPSPSSSGGSKGPGGDGCGGCGGGTKSNGTNGSGKPSGGGTNQQTQSQTQGRGGQPPSGRDPAMGGGGTPSHPTRDAGQGSTPGGNNHYPSENSGRNPNDSFNGSGGGRSGGAQSSNQTSGRGDRPGGSPEERAQANAESKQQYARDLANYGAYKNPSSRVDSITRTINNTTEALSNALGGLFGSSNPADKANPGNTQTKPAPTNEGGYVSDVPTYKPSAPSADRQYNRDRQATAAEVRAALQNDGGYYSDIPSYTPTPQPIKYDVTETSLAKELNPNGKTVYTQPAVTESFNTPFGNLGEIVDPKALATPKQREAFVKSLLTTVYGLPDNQVRAIVGNLAEESARTFNPKIVGDKTLVNKAYGIAQERGSRKKSLESLAGTGVKNTNLADQVAHVVAEMQGTSPLQDKGAMKVGKAYAANPSMSVAEATKLFVTNFERPRGSNVDAAPAAKEFFRKTLNSRIEAANKSAGIESFGEINNVPSPPTSRDATPSKKHSDTDNAKPPISNIAPTSNWSLGALIQQYTPTKIADGIAAFTKKAEAAAPKLKLYNSLPTWAQNIVRSLYVGTGGGTPNLQEGGGETQGTSYSNQNKSTSSSPFPLVP